MEDLAAEIAGQKILIESNSPSEGVPVAFIEVNGAPKVDRPPRPDV